MTAYIVRRLLLLIPTLFLITILVFTLIRIVPGNVVDFVIETNLIGSQATVRP